MIIDTPIASSISYQRLQALFDASLDVICSIDKEGRFLDISKAAKSVWGYQPEELQGVPYMNLVVEEDRQKTIQAAHDIMSGVDMTYFENRYLRKDGSVIPMVWSARWDEAEEIMYCVAKSIAKKKAAEEKLKEAEREKNQAKQLFGLFMKHSPLMAWITDSHGSVQYMNPVYLRKYGFSEAHIGKSLNDLFPAEVAEAYLRSNAKVITGQEGSETMEREVTGEGKEQTLKIIRFPISLGSETLCAGWAFDITREDELQQELEDHLERYNLVNAATSDAIYDWNVTTNTIYRGKNFRTIFGFENLTVPFEFRLSRIHPEDVPGVNASIEAALLDTQCQKWNLEYRFRDSDDQYRYVLDKGCLVRENGKAVRVIGAIQDITEQKRLQGELAELNRYKDRVVSLIAHDLRGPLSSSISFMEYISENSESFTRDELLENIEMVRTNSQACFTLLEELLLWAQSQMNKVSYTPSALHLEKEIAVALAPLQKQCTEKGIGIETLFSGISAVYADANMFRTVVRNFVSNALKFSPAGSRIVISAGKKGKDIVFSVRDQGIGMARSVQEKIMQGQNTVSSFGTKGEKGFGLGLSLTKDFIEKNGGCMRIESEQGKGSTFYFTVPAA